jgi:hypothetical protein
MPLTSSLFSSGSLARTSWRGAGEGMMINGDPRWVSGTWIGTLLFWEERETDADPLQATDALDVAAGLGACLHSVIQPTRRSRPCGGGTTPCSVAE